MENTMTQTLAIIGAGPVGLAAAAHALERGIAPIVLEAGPAAGHAIAQWGHVRMFSTWGLNIDKASARLLARNGWVSPDPLAHPTGAELRARYVEPLAKALEGHIRFAHRVRSIGRAGLDKVKTVGRDAAPFELIVDGPDGAYRLRADAVIDASGTWSAPNPAGADGRPAPGEAENAARIAYAMPDVAGSARARYAGKIVAVLGGGHSAIGTLIELDAIAAKTVWLHRGADLAKTFGGGGADKLAARGALGTEIAERVRVGRIATETGFRLAAIEAAQDGLRLRAEDGRVVAADELIVATGFRPDLDMLREIRLALDPALECPAALGPLIDPNVHSCGTVRPHGAKELAQPEPGFFLAGMKAYGRAPTFLLATGYEQTRSIVAHLAGDDEAALRVELELPETGVCAGPKPKLRVAAIAAAPEAASGCCGGPAKTEDACCLADEAAKAAGESGCGCAEPALTSASADTR
jgi:thioredoxin reductase